MIYLKIIVTISLLLTLVRPLAAEPNALDAEANSQRVVFYNRTFSPAIRSIFADVMQRVMQLTEPEFGPYQIENFIPLSNSTRMMHLVERGEVVQVCASAPQDVPPRHPGVAHIPVPFVGAALGLRKITVRRDGINLFQDITYDQLSQLRVGLGYNWAEKSVYIGNSLPFAEAIDHKSLLPMLNKQRFDYITFGALDNQYYNDEHFITLSNPLIYHPIPVYVHVSERHPQLVERIKLGMERFINSGEAGTLIQQRLQHNSPLKENSAYDVLVIHNPLYTEQENTEAVARLNSLLPEGITMAFKRLKAAAN